MAFYIKLDDVKTIELPSELSLDERIELCSKVINENFEYFEQSLPDASREGGIASSKVKSRLNIMATYILNATPKDDKSYTLLTEYKEKRNNRCEIMFSTMEYD